LGSNIAFNLIIGYKNIALKGGKQMSVYLENIKKFLKDHKELFDEPAAKQVLERAEKIAQLNGGLIVSGEIRGIFEDSRTIEIFFKEIQSSEHVQIFSKRNLKNL
jgi:hypothetical protein